MDAGLIPVATVPIAVRPSALMLYSDSVLSIQFASNADERPGENSGVNADRYLLGITGDMQPLEKMQLESGFPVTSTAGPAQGQGLWIRNHRKEETADARFSGTERQRERQAAPIEFFLDGCLIVHVDTEDGHSVH